MEYQEALNYVHSFLKFGSKLGLDRMNTLLEKLDNPQKDLKFLHVAGTNGKGSTSLMMQSAITSAGYKCGLFISPYVVDFCERIQIDGEYIPKDKLCYYVNRIKKILQTLPEDKIPTEFEIITAIAFSYFFEEGVDYAVLEVGLGGRGDATNVIKSPLVSVISKIDLDHTGILGDTIEKITAEKCGIIKKNCPVATTSSQTEEALSVIKEFSEKNGGDLLVSDEPTDISVKKEGTNFSLSGEKYKVKMLGSHQAHNAALAIAGLKQSGINIKKSDIDNGLLSQMPARAEIISNSPFVLLDGGHNPAGAESLKNLLNELNINSATAIIGMMADKDVESVIKTVSPHFENAVSVTVEGNPRAIGETELKNICAKYIKNTYSAPDYDSAIKLASKVSKGAPVICLGSLYLAGDIREKLKNYFN